jgi:Na+-transporting NADH:ubiquinone oxidoreductase subunit A
MQIVLKKGLDLPLPGKPLTWVQPLPKPHTVALDLDQFEKVPFRLLVKEGDKVLIGSPLSESKTHPGMYFVSPGAGTILQIKRGSKRRVLSIVIGLDETEESLVHSQPHFEREELISFMLKSGIFPHIKMRPFDLVPSPSLVPRDIFVRAIESLPFVPSSEIQLQGHEEAFKVGLEALKLLTSGVVHVVSRPDTTLPQVEKVTYHTVIGPHPAGNVSLHIQKIAPIQNTNDCVWTLGVCDVIVFGKMLTTGRYHTDRVIALAGEGFEKSSIGWTKGRMGYPVRSIGHWKENVRIISGDPLVGRQLERDDHLGFFDTVCSLIPENQKREPLHFLGLKSKGYSATRAYLKKGNQFTTSQHGEERAFVDGEIYQKVMPLQIPAMHLVKAILSENYEQAVELGLLEVASEDFALPTFIDPSKIEMVDIVKQGLHRFAAEMGY